MVELMSSGGPDQVSDVFGYFYPCGYFQPFVFDVSLVLSMYCPLYSLFCFVSTLSVRFVCHYLLTFLFFFSVFPKVQNHSVWRAL